MLIVDDRWLVIGPNRHGTLYATKVLEAAFPGRVKYPGGERKHTPYCHISRREREGLRVVSMVKCPLRFYLSKWRTHVEHTKRKPPYTLDEYFDLFWGDPHGTLGKNMESLPFRGDIGVWSYQHVAYHCERAATLLGNWPPSDIAKHFEEECAVDCFLQTEHLSRDLVLEFGDRVLPHLEQTRNATKGAECLGELTPHHLRMIRDADEWLAELYPFLGCHKLWEGLS